MTKEEAKERASHFARRALTLDHQMRAFIRGGMPTPEAVIEKAQLAVDAKQELEAFKLEHTDLLVAAECAPPTDHSFTHCLLPDIHGRLGR